MDLVDEIILPTSLSITDLQHCPVPGGSSFACSIVLCLLLLDLFQSYFSLK